MTSTPEVALTRERTRSIYRGDPGMWSWALHRITGVATFFFLFVHVLDTALMRVSQESYNAVIGTYQNPIVALMELSLVAVVLYHGLNGLRIIAVDFWAKGCHYQKQMLWAVATIWIVVMIPATFRIIQQILKGLS